VDRAGDLDVPGAHGPPPEKAENGSTDEENDSDDRQPYEALDGETDNREDEPEHEQNHEKCHHVVSLCPTFEILGLLKTVVGDSHGR
jgi:hypothetical protein